MYVLNPHVYNYYKARFKQDSSKKKTIQPFFMNRINKHVLNMTINMPTTVTEWEEKFLHSSINRMTLQKQLYIHYMVTPSSASL